MRKFDLLVIGAGSGGVRAARLASALGVTVAIAEADRVGGTCVVRGCVPKKLTVYASRFADEIRNASSYGWAIPSARFSWEEFKASRDAEVRRLEGIYVGLLQQSNVELLRGRVSFVDSHTLQLDSTGECVVAEKVLIATGGAPAPARGMPGGEHLVTSDDLFDLDRQPGSIVIHGGGYIAVEFASILCRLGARVTVVHRDRRLLAGFDAELSGLALESLLAAGVEVMAERTIERIHKLASGFEVRLGDGQSREADIVLGATGRAPNVSGLGLANAGVVQDKTGAISVDRFSRTSVPHIFAVGDVTNRLGLTPAAIREAQAFVRTVYEGLPTAATHLLAPTTVFATPELGSVGLTEEEATASHRGLDVYTSTFRSMKESLRGGSQRVFMKMLVSREDKSVVGCHMAGPDAGEAIQLLALSMTAKATKTHFEETMAVHPTIAEEWMGMRKPIRRYVEGRLVEADVRT